MSEWSEHFIPVNGVDIHYYRIGDDKKPPLILLHGFTDSGRCWSHVAHNLAKNYDVLMPDARGHGRSQGAEVDFSAELLAQDVLALIRMLKLDRPMLYGHSMGAITALAAASTSHDIRAIVLEDPPLQHTTPTQVDPQESQRRWQWIFEVRALPEEEREAQCRAANPNWAEEEIEPWATAKVEFDIKLLKQVDTIQVPWRKLVPHITCPVLLLTGDPKRGAIITPEMAREFVQLCKHGETVRFDGAGHNIHRDRYEAAMTAVRAFLNRSL